MPQPVEPQKPARTKPRWGPGLTRPRALAGSGTRGRRAERTRIPGISAEGIHDRPPRTALTSARPSVAERRRIVNSEPTPTRRRTLGPATTTRLARPRLFTRSLDPLALAGRLTVIGPGIANTHALPVGSCGDASALRVCYTRLIGKPRDVSSI
jgi:hypothetical protein